MIWSQKNKPRQAQPLRPMPKTRLDGFRVYARPPRLSDWAQWADVRGDNKLILMPKEPRWPSDALTEEFFGKRVARQTRNWHEDRGYSFLLFLNDTDTLIGGVNINNVCRGAAQYASLGYWLDHRHQGAGYMTEALRLVISHGFTHLRLHRFNAGCLPENTKSIKVLERLGFKEEGFARSYLEIGGEWRDHNLYGLIVEDWTDSVTRDV